MFVYKRKKKSINNQTTEYNENDENTTVKDLQRRAIFKRCATKRLDLFYRYSVESTKKNSNTGEQIFNEELFLNLKTVAP